jgi:hypothetical protein
MQATGEDEAKSYTHVLTAARDSFGDWKLMLIRDSNIEVATFSYNLSMMRLSPLSMELPLSVNTFDFPEAGSHVYSVRARLVTGSVQIKGARLVAYEFSKAGTAVTPQATARNASIKLAANGQQYSKWAEIGKVAFDARHPGRPIIVSVMADSHPSISAEAPYTIRLSSSGSGLVNRWQARYVRDSKVQISSFTLSITAAEPQAEISLPLNLTALDTPAIGPHTYALQIRYIGDQKGTFGEIHIENGRLTLSEL